GEAGNAIGGGLGRAGGRTFSGDLLQGLQGQIPARVHDDGHPIKAPSSTLLRRVASTAGDSVCPTAEQCSGPPAAQETSWAAVMGNGDRKRRAVENRSPSRAAAPKLARRCDDGCPARPSP